MPTKYINPFTDFGFKRIFGTEENKDVLLDFLNAVLQHLEIQIVELNYKNTEIQGINEEDRKIIFDLYCTNEKGETFIIELQIGRQKYFQKRLVFYSSRLIQNQGVKQKDWDYNFNGVYTVALLNFEFPDNDEQIVSTFRILNQENYKPLIKDYGFITIQLRNFNKTEEELETTLDEWIFCLKNMQSFDKIPARLQKFIFVKVFKLSEYIALSESERKKYDRSLMEYNDYKNVIDFAREEGKEELKKEYEEILKEAKRNEEEAKRNEEEAKASLVIVIKGMIENGIDLEKIAKMLGKSQEEIIYMFK